MKTITVFILLISSFLPFIYAQRRSVILMIQPQNVTTFPGRQIDLKCVFSGPTSSSCYWSQNNRNFKPDGREFVFSGNISNGNCSLRIPNATIEHDGYYKCGFMTYGSQQGIASDPPAKVTILHRPNFPQVEYKEEIITDGEIRVPKDDSDILVACIARDGNPVATAEWWSNSTETLAETITIIDSNISPFKTIKNEMNISKTEKLQHTSFTCIVNHETYNSSITLDIFIILEGAVTKTILHSNSTGTHVQLNYGQTIAMNCTSYAEPKPKYKWEKKYFGSSEWEVFGNEDQVQLITNGGIYRCGAKNGYNDLEYIYSSEIQVEDGKTPMQAGVITGIVLSVTFVCILLAVITFCAYRKRRFCFAGKNKRNTTKDDKSPQELETLQEVHK